MIVPQKVTGLAVSRQRHPKSQQGHGDQYDPGYELHDFPHFIFAAVQVGVGERSIGLSRCPVTVPPRSQTNQQERLRAL